MACECDRKVLKTKNLKLSSRSQMDFMAPSRRTLQYIDLRLIHLTMQPCTLYRFLITSYITHTHTHSHKLALDISIIHILVIFTFILETLNSPYTLYKIQNS